MAAVQLSVMDLAAKPLGLLPPEAAQNLTIQLLRTGIRPILGSVEDGLLETTVAGLKFPNPLGMAPGFDKNALVTDKLLSWVGFGFVEVGAVTPKPQIGNPIPRVFRLRADKAVINRRGFSNDGIEQVRKNLSKRKHVGIVGVNVGANKDSSDWFSDYADCIRALDGCCDYFTVNVSSPNTPGLRDLQSAELLDKLLTQVLEARQHNISNNAPIFVKIAPDLSDEQKSDICKIAVTKNISGLVVSNTTVSRPQGIGSLHSNEIGGLSGRPLFKLSTELLKEFYKEVGGKMPLIGVGGVSSARDTYEKILAGASLVQLYTALIYEGVSLPRRILDELPMLLQSDGFDSIAEAVGAGHA